MPTINHITHMRSRQRSLEQRRSFSKLALGCAGLISVLATALGILLASAYTQITRNLPSVETLSSLLEPPDGLMLQPTRLYDREGHHLLLTLQNPAATDRQYLPIASLMTNPSENHESGLPANLITATVGAADPGFWSHSGFSMSGLWQGNHTTLAQQLVSDFLLADEPASLNRSLRERLLAAQITRRFGRQKILEWYLNHADYGRLAYGADAAARVYFKKTATELSLAEAAMLAAIPQAPDLNPVDAPQAALERQRRGIQSLLRYRMISPKQGIEAVREKLVIQSSEIPGQVYDFRDSKPNLAPTFTRLVLQDLSTHIPRNRLVRGGLRVLTTLDYDLQMQIECAASAQLEILKNPQGGGTTTSGQDCPAARLLPTISSFSVPITESVTTNAVVLDPASGQVLALVGGSPRESLDIPLSEHPAGTIITPFVYLTAFARGLSPATLIWDVPGGNQADTVPNFDGVYHGPMRLRNALANDYVAPAEKVLSQVGVENTWRTSQQFGLQYPQPLAETTPSILGLTRDLDLVEMSQAFGIFANQGVLAGRPLQAGNEFNNSALGGAPRPPHLDPVTVMRVEDTTGQAWLDWQISYSRPIISPQLAYLMTNVLSDEIARWPSMGHPNALEIGRPAAVKLGRAPAGDSNWVIGYTPQRVAGAWIGQDNPKTSLPSQAKDSLAQAAAGLWHAIIQYASRDLPAQSWTIPDGMSTMRVCDPSGMLPTSDCPNVVDEVFLPGNEPIQIDNLYRSLQTNRDNGKLATVFTPLDQVKESSYFIVPQQAEAWTGLAGLELPPSNYDAIPANIQTWEDAQITSPAMFDAVNGEVVISGRAAGPEFDYYRIDVGEGLNPEVWLQVGEDIHTPVRGGQLAVWDTRGLSGLFAIQLLVVRQDQSLEKATTLVTVDNEAPEIQILHPMDGEEVSVDNSDPIVIQIEVHDDLEVESVAVYLDERLFAILTQSPFSISWEAIPGSHSLRVQATDRAGNTSDSSAEFTVKSR